MKTSIERVELPLETPFTISRGTKRTVENVIVVIEHNDSTGYGAAAPARYYGETADTVTALLPELLDAVESVGDPHARTEIHERMATVAGDNPAAKAAVDTALWDLAGQLLGEPVYRLLGLSASASCPPTSYTVGLDDPKTMAERAKAAVDAGYPVLKLKLGSERDRDIVRSVREVAPEATIRVDANEAWTPSAAVQNCKALADYGVEFVEQPVAAGNAEGLRRVYEQSPLPIAADESCVVAGDIPDIADSCDIVNLKLMKTGGLTPAVEAIYTARAHGLDVMCGCMVETNASIAAAVQLLPLLSYADLDGSLLLDSDPYKGVPVSNGQFDLEAVDCGTGVAPR